MQKVKVIKVPGTTTEVEVNHSLSVNELLHSIGLEINHEIESVFVGNSRVVKEDMEKTYIIGGVIIIAKGARGEVPTPKLKSATEFLTNIGYVKESANGDHIKFKKANFTTIILNSDNSDKKHIDLGSAKSLAKAFNLTLSELYQRL